ncbi:hypothetical protein [Amycolatopsis anabasis]|uniref:hypothetical protein n=1 Tax=Amycolatopsis anabasis TaxID=1840409 RepID=UPI00131BDD11|nr:hypothetical protein [Amycolatopsis anabasis]
MLKKAGFVAALAAGLTLIGGTAMASPAKSPAPAPRPAAQTQQAVDPLEGIQFHDAYHQFIEGGGALGYGAASLVAGAYAGIARTPWLIMNPLGD